MCHNEFWKRLDQRDIIVRTFNLGTYWLDRKNAKGTNEKKSEYNDLSLDGITQNEHSTNRRQKPSYYFLPWLKSPAW